MSPRRKAAVEEEQPTRQVDGAKRAVLDKAVGDILKRFGEGSIMPLGQPHGMVTESFPTGSLSLDIALGVGGVPRGRITEIYGPESSGKTTICQHIVAEAQRMGGTAAFINKARFAGEVLSLRNLEFHRDDVRNLDTERYGTFDVVLCLGILYHLDAPDLFRMIAQVASVCKRFVVLDTHVSADARECREHRGRRYWGCAYEEHAPESDIEERLAALWSSLDNPRSFWLTKPSLYNALAHASFTSIYECHYPVETGKPSDRVTLLALKGERQTVRAAPLVNAVLPGEWPGGERDTAMSVAHDGMMRRAIAAT